MNSTDKPKGLAWADPIKRLSGRLRIEFEDLKPGLRHAVYLELKNYSFDPIAVINNPQIRTELFDSAGRSISASGLSTSGPILNPQWAVIPRDAYIGFRIDMQTVGVPTKKQGMALIAVGGKSWELKAGEYVLKATVSLKKEEDGPHNQWIGELELPPSQFVVTTRMLAMN
jgi:hypothetical protein